jgi:STE24 endopeptidase
MLFFLISTAAACVYYWFAYQQTVPSHLAGTAADPLTFMSEAEAKHTAVYSALRDVLFFVSYLWEWGMLLWLLTSGTARTLVQGLKRRLPSVIIRFPVYIAGISVTLFLLGLPLRLLSYSISKRYGISTLPLPGWLRDQLVHLCLNFGLLLAAGSVVFFLVRKGGTWWFRLWLLSIPFVLFMMYIKPVAIDPLFYRYEPLSDPQLQRSIIEMTSRAGVPTERIFEANFSKKTNAINAYVDGIGPSLRIVIWDTALQKLTEPEIVVMTAHEVGHYVFRHLQWSAAGAIGSLLVTLWFGNKIFIFVLKRWRSFLFIRNPADWAGLPLMLLILSVFTFLMTPLSSAVSRNAEREADRFAYELTGQPAAAVTLFQKLSVSSRGNIHPPALTYWFRYTHPSLGERIEEALTHEREAK